jgi:glyoxylase-like metal-dependent hydrolase (beta-lactamase superfamily II)
MDHCGCNQFFKKATFVAHATEWATAADPSSEGKGYFRDDWDHPMRRDAIDGAKDLFDDDAIVLLPLPGHTPGSIGAKLELPRTGCVVLAADAAAVRANMTSEFSPKNSWNADQFRRSLGELQRLDQQRAMLLFGHDADQWATLKKGADAYD